jgi:5-methylcytosine-specific restriction endonuclease McrA
MKIQITKLDRLFSTYIRTRDKFTCQRCGKYYEPPTKALHCSHFWGRSNKKVRWDEENADAHCYGCHQYLGSRPVEFTEWKKKQLGDKRFEMLNVRANWRDYSKADTEALFMYYTQKLKELDGK